MFKLITDRLIVAIVQKIPNLHISRTFVDFQIYSIYITRYITA